MIKKVFLLATLFILIPLLAEAKNLYVNNSGSPACSDATTYANNSSSLPWCTIGRAAWGSTSRSSPNTSQAAQAGDIVLVTAGVYWENGAGSGGGRWDVALNSANSGTSGNPITFRGVGNVYIRMNNNQRGPMIGCQNRSYIIWDNFQIDDYYGGSTSDTGPVVFNAATYCQVINSNIKGHPGSYYWGYPTYVQNYNGVRIEYGNNNTVKNNKIYDFLPDQNEAGIMLYDSNDNIMENNEIYNCGDGIFVKGGTVRQDGNIIRYNYIYNCVAQGIFHGMGNRYGKTYQNIVINSGKGITIRGNVDDSYVVNNTVVNNPVQFMFQGFDSGNVTTVANNITFGGNNAYHSWDGATPTGSTVNRNNFYNISSTFAYMADGSYSLATWRSTFGYDVNSITDNPQFVGGSGVAAYKLQSGSPARTLGRTITAIHGSSGQTIPAGAYITGNEVIGLVSGAPSDTTPPSTPTNLTATAVSSSQINLSWTASTDNVGVSGYRIYRCQGTSCTADTQIATSSTNSYQDTGLAASTTYRYRLRAYDAAGNLSSYSSTASATTQDTTPPGAPIWGPNPIQRVD